MLGAQTIHRLSAYIAVALLPLAYLCLSFFPSTQWWGGGIGFAACVALSWACPSDVTGIRRAQVFLVIAGAFLLVPVIGSWVLPAVGCLAILVFRPRYFSPQTSLNTKRVWGVVLFSLVAAAVSVAGLAFWRSSKSFFLVEWFPLWVDPILHVPFFLLSAAANAVFEEHLWRGMSTDLLRPNIATAVFVAACFGLTHYAALPSGVVGVFMTFAFSLIASGLRAFSGGSLVPAIAVHFFADLYLFSITA